MSIQQIRRTVTAPQIPDDAPAWFRSFVFTQYVQLTSQVNAIHAGLQQYQSGSAALGAITAGNASKVLTFVGPFTDTLYAVAALPDWNTTVYFSAKGNASITINFGTAAPGSQNCLVIVMR